jgi:hypothetical protein
MYLHTPIYSFAKFTIRGFARRFDIVRQKANPVVAATIIGVVVLIAAVAVLWAWRAPSVQVDTSQRTGPGGTTQAGASGKSGPRFTNDQVHGTPTSDQMAQIQEWKKTHPGASTRY